MYVYWKELRWVCISSNSSVTVCIFEIWDWLFPSRLGCWKHGWWNWLLVKDFNGVQEMWPRKAAAPGVFVEKQDGEACARKAIWNSMKISDTDVIARQRGVSERWRPPLFVSRRQSYSNVLAFGSATSWMQHKLKKVKLAYGAFPSTLFPHLSATEGSYTCNKKDLWTHQGSVQMN